MSIVFFTRVCTTLHIKDSHVLLDAPIFQPPRHLSHPSSDTNSTPISSYQLHKRLVLKWPINSCYVCGPGAKFELPKKLTKTTTAGTFGEYMKSLLRSGRTFNTINVEYQEAVCLGTAVWVHGDTKSITRAQYCYEKGRANKPDVRYLCLVESDQWDTSKVLIKAPFGKVDQSKRKTDTIDGNIFKRTVMEALKEAEAPCEFYNPYNVEDID
ncbi:hypothetical protein CPB85DRAFT_1438701 [Mucidula mucida]|nr:hypothetical protein CPB85DRAFT_1438701 [Mucidula mucida]